MRKALLTAIAALGLTMSAQADNVDFVSTTPDFTQFVWSYNFSIDEETRVDTGDFFTIYDFTGFNGFTAAPTGWAYNAMLMSTLPPIFPDNPGVPNISFERTGGTQTGSAIFSGFLIGSTQNTPVTGAWVSETTDNADVPGGPTGGRGVTLVPIGGGGDIPEPGTYALLGSGLAALALVRRFRK